MNTETRNEIPPRVSVIIPSLDGHRGGAVPRLLESIARQSFHDYEIILEKGVSPQGKAINQCVARARGEILIILDDDTCLADEEVFTRLIAAIDADAAIGMAGASIILPPDATPFQRRAAKQFPRFNMPVVDTLTDSDLACHGCCAIPKNAFYKAGQEREDVLRGLDPDLRVRLRKAGCRVVLVPGACVYHPMPNGFYAVLRVFFRNGFGSAYARKFHPDMIYETHESLHVKGFQPRTSLIYRIMRFPLRLLKALLLGRIIRFAAYLAYAAGYTWGIVMAQDRVGADIGARRL